MVQWEMWSHRAANALNNRKDNHFGMICVLTFDSMQRIMNHLATYSITASQLDK